MDSAQIRKYRLSIKATQSEFAYDIAVSVVTVNRWEAGGSKPSRLAINKIKEHMKKKVKNEHD